MSMKKHWMAAFGPNRPTPLYDQPLTYSTGNFGTSFGTHRVGRVDVLGDATQEMIKAVALGYYYVILDNADMIGLGRLQELVTKAYGYGLSVVARNPAMTQGPLQYISHMNVAGVIVTAGLRLRMLAEHDDLRRRAWKDGIIPVWYVCDTAEDAVMYADRIKAGRYKGMGVIGGGKMFLPEV